MSIYVFNLMAEINYQQLKDHFSCGNLAKFSLVTCFEESGSTEDGVISLTTVFGP